MDELLVVLGALVTLVLSIAGMNVHRWRTDVLTGPYISNRDHEQTIPDSRMDRVDRATAERAARCAPSGDAARADRAKKSNQVFFKPTAQGYDPRRFG
jgi:hypothetical protein